MRISTNQIFSRGLNGMLVQQAETLKLQQQLSSQKKIQSPSEDPLAAAKIQTIKQQLNATDVMQQNREASSASLSFEEGILGNVVNVMQRLRELQVQAGNTALSTVDRKAMSEEAQKLSEQLQDLGNTKDANGYYIFSGSQTATQPFNKNTLGQIVYNGDDTQRMQVIGNGMEIAVNDNGADIFMRIPNGNGTFSLNSGPTNTGQAWTNTGSVVDISSFTRDDYTIQFALNTSNQMVVMISGATLGPIIPASGLPDDAAPYVEGSAINFNGISITVSGQPAVGDSFEVKPSKNESLFDTAERIVANLQRSFVSASDKAEVQTENNQLMEQLDTSLSNILSYRAETGARLNQLDVVNQINLDIIDISNETLHMVEDIDMAEVAVKLNLQQIYLQAAQQSFARIQGLTVFNYI